VNDSRRVIELDGRRLLLTDVDRSLFPEDGYTKLDLIEYYTEMAEYVLPSLSDRPLGLVRAPDGATGPSIYHKHALPAMPAWITVRHIRVDASASSRLPYVVGADRMSLAYLVNLGCISFHPWNSAGLCAPFSL
jgi:bifunctional non-homologous end joining protein LigD